MAELSPLERAITLVSSLVADQEALAFRQEGFSELTMRQVGHMEAIIRLGHPSFGELAGELGITRPSVTAIVARLAAAGYVEKVQDPEDRRSFHVVLTEKGEAFSRLHRDIHRRIARALTARLDADEVRQLAGLLQKIMGQEP